MWNMGMMGRPLRNKNRRQKLCRSVKNSVNFSIIIIVCSRCNGNRKWHLRGCADHIYKHFARLDAILHFVHPSQTVNNTMNTCYKETRGRKKFYSKVIIIISYYSLLINGSCSNFCQQILFSRLLNGEIDTSTGCLLRGIHFFRIMARK